MKIHVIGTRGWSYAGMEDLVRELGPRFIRDGHQFTIHAWATEDSIESGITTDEIQNGVKRIFHETSYGKFTGQLIVATKSSIKAAFSDCDVIYYAFIQNGIYSWFPRLMGKKILINVDGIMWKDPKWPPVFRHLFFPIGAYLCYFFGNKVITDSYHMQQLYHNKFRIHLDWAGYGCAQVVPEKQEIDLNIKCPKGYYIIMSRMTPHNLTDILIEGFIKSKSESHLVLAGHIPDNKWFMALKERTEGNNITFLGLIKDQDYLNQILLNAKAYLHGHSLGGINPALVRVVGMDKPAICVDTVFNREVVEYPNGKVQACLFQKNADSVANEINKFESNEIYYLSQAKELGSKIREMMSWENIYQKYKSLLENM